MAFPIHLCNEVIRTLDFRRQCAFASAVGYDGLEIAPFTLSEAPHKLTGGEIREFRSIADGEGVAIGGLHWLLAAPGGLSITSEDEKVFRKTVDVGRRMLALCSELGGTYLVHGSPSQRQLQQGRESEGRRWAGAYFAAIAESARSAGLSYYLEPLWRGDTGLVTSVEEAIAIIEEVGHPALATMIDCCAAARNGEDLPALLRRWLPGGMVRHVHFNDPNLRGPGEGMLAFGPILDVLSDLRYTGSVAVEPFEYHPDGPACAARAIGYLRGIFEARRDTSNTRTQE